MKIYIRKILKSEIVEGGGSLRGATNVGWGWVVAARLKARKKVKGKRARGRNRVRGREG